MKTRLRKLLSFLAVSPLVIAASCSTEDKKRGQIMIAVTSDLSVPANMNEVTVEIVGDDGVKQSRSYILKPSELGKPLPGTIAIVPPNAGGQRLRVRVIGQLNTTTAEARVLREAIVIVPRDRVGLLHMPIRWLCDGEVTTNERGDVTSPCNDGVLDGPLTCKAGSCVDVDMTAVELPEYEPAVVYGGGEEDGTGGTCFDVTQCFEKGATVTIDPQNCTIPLPQGGEGVSVGIVPADRSKGICPEQGAPGDCYIPIDQDDEDGWKEASGRIQLPPALCNGPKAAQVTRVVVTTACETKKVGTPLCGPWSNVKTKAPVGPQTPPVGSGGGGLTDGGPGSRDDGGPGSRDDGSVVGRTDAIAPPPPDGGAGGARAVDASPGQGGSACAGDDSVILSRPPPGAMFIVVDGSAQGAATMTPVPTHIQTWLNSAASRLPELGVGYAVSMNSCGDPPVASFPVVPVSSRPPVPLVTLGQGDFSPSEGVQEAHQRLLAWPQPQAVPRAIVVISAQGSLACDTSTLNSDVSGFLANDGVFTHVLSPGPGSVNLFNLASAGGTTRVVTFDAQNPNTLLTALDTIADGLVYPCVFEPPPGGSGTGTVLLRAPSLNDITLPLRSAGCADGDGYFPSSSVPGGMELCPPACTLFQASPGAEIVASSGPVSCPPQGTGGGTSGGSAGAGSGVDAAPAPTCPPPPSPGSPCPFPGQQCDYGASICTCQGVWNCVGGGPNCGADVDCQPLEFCDTSVSQCGPRRPPGAPCDRPEMCLSGTCTANMCQP